MRTFLTLTLTKVSTRKQSLGHTLVWPEGLWQVQEQTNPGLHMAGPGEHEAAWPTTNVCSLSATQNGTEISILPSATGLQESASSRSRAVDGSMVKTQSFLGKIEDIISDATNNRNFTPL